NPSAGDFFTVPLPDQLRTYDVMNRTLLDPDGAPMACMSIKDGQIQVVFLDYVNTHTNITGSFWAQYTVSVEQTEENETVTTDLYGIGTIDINVEGTGPVGPDDYWGKDGWFFDRSQGANDPDGALVWRLTLPQQLTTDVDIE